MTYKTTLKTLFGLNQFLHELVSLIALFEGVFSYLKGRDVQIKLNNSFELVILNLGNLYLFISIYFPFSVKHCFR